MRELKYRSDAGFLRALFWEGATDDAPLLVDIHGGGFCLGSADGDIGLCERLVRETGCAAAAAVFPPTLILTGGRDSLRTDGIRFYELLRSAGAVVRHVEYSAARHAFIETVSSGRMGKNFYTSERAAKEQIDCYERAVQEIKNWIRGVR